MHWGHRVFTGFHFQSPFFGFIHWSGPGSFGVGQSRARYRRYLEQYREWLQEELSIVEEELEELHRQG